MYCHSFLILLDATLPNNNELERHSALSMKCSFMFYQQTWNGFTHHHSPDLRWLWWAKIRKIVGERILSWCESISAGRAGLRAEKTNWLISFQEDFSPHLVSSLSLAATENKLINPMATVQYCYFTLNFFSTLTLKA